MAAGPTPFLFGKLPAHGDFVSRGLSDSERQAWDDWASAVIETLRDRCGEGFEAAHDSAPPWRFISGPSRLGPGWRAGALATSVDGAGRRFVVAMGVQGWTAAEACVFGFATAETVEALIYRALAEASPADAAVAAIRSHLAECDLASLRAANALGVQPGAPGVWWTLESADQGLFASELPPPGVLAATALQQTREMA